MSDTKQPSSPGKKQKQMPPDMILGPDGKPCKLCTAIRNWRPETIAKQLSESGQNKKTSFSTTATMMGALAGYPTSSRPEIPRENCPADVEQLGRATWTFLHTTAAYYPERPSAAQRAHMFGLLSALPSLYPCTHCASHLGENVKAHPPDVSGRVALSRWLCERHNDVNERLGKPVFDCSIEKTDERWKDGPSDGRCD